MLDKSCYRYCFCGLFFCVCVLFCLFGVLGFFCWFVFEGFFCLVGFVGLLRGFFLGFAVVVLFWFSPQVLVYTLFVSTKSHLCIILHNVQILLV